MSYYSPKPQRVEKMMTGCPEVHRLIQLGDGKPLRSFIDPMLMRIGKRGERYCVTAVTRTPDGLYALRDDGCYLLMSTGHGKRGDGRTETLVDVIDEVLSEEQWENVLAVAGRADISAVLVDHSDTAPVPFDADVQACPRSSAGQVASILFERYRKGMRFPAVITLEPFPNASSVLKTAVLLIAKKWQLSPGFLTTLMRNGDFYEADCLKEAAAASCEDKKGSRFPVILAEGWERMALNRIPDALRSAFSAEPSVSAGASAMEAVALIRLLQRVLLALITPVQQALQISSKRDVLLDEALRPFFAEIAVHEVLPLVGVEKGQTLPLLKEQFDRFENPFYETVDPMGLAEAFAVWRSVLLPELFKSQDPPACLTLAFGILVMQLIEGAKGSGAENAFRSLSADMAPDQLAYAILKDTNLWGEAAADLFFGAALERAFTDLQLKGVLGSIQERLKQP